MSSLYNRMPSEILGIEDEYTGYCLNEACAYIHAKLDAGETPRFQKKFKSFTDMYDSYKRG